MQQKVTRGSAKSTASAKASCTYGAFYAYKLSVICLRVYCQV